MVSVQVDCGATKRASGLRNAAYGSHSTGTGEAGRSINGGQRRELARGVLRRRDEPDRSAAVSFRPPAVFPDSSGALLALRLVGLRPSLLCPLGDPRKRGETRPRSPSSLPPRQGSFLREACGSDLALLSHPLIVHGLPGPWSYCYLDAAMYRVLHTVESLRWSALPTSPQRPEPLSVPAGRCATVPPVRRHGYHGLVSYMLLCLCLLLLQTSCSYSQVLRLPVV